MTEHNLEFLSLTRGCTGLSESTLVKMPHCWKSHCGSYIFPDCIVVADADARDKGSDTESSSEEDRRKVCSYLYLLHTYFVGNIVF